MYNQQYYGDAIEIVNLSVIWLNNALNFVQNTFLKYAFVFCLSVCLVFFLGGLQRYKKTYILLLLYSKRRKDCPINV